MSDFMHKSGYDAQGAGKTIKAPFTAGGRPEVSPVGGFVGPSGTHENGGQQVSFTFTAAASTAITGTLVDILATQECFIRISNAGTGAVADGTDYFIKAQLQYRLPITNLDRISVIRLTTNGILYIHPVATS